MEPSQLRTEIESNLSTRIRAVIYVEPRQYISLARAVVRRVADLYAVALNVERDEFDQSREREFHSLEEFIANSENPENPAHVICAQTGDRVYEFCAVDGDRLIATGYGNDLDYFHSIDIVGHNAAIELAKAMLQPGAKYASGFESKFRTKLALMTGQKISQQSAANDGQPFTYVLGPETDVDISTREITSPWQVYLGSRLERLYRDMVF
ncbi:MAG: hypothetical protein EPN86_01705 [Nanoarchaeota archaeon]|nr:MAG: hypothetical protein EPN86_01705 [Nanoarchaeota archaeon]